jgi:hypothetical protein
LDKNTFYELFLKEFNDLENQKQTLLDKLRHGRNIWITAQQLAELEIRSNELDRIFLILKRWF